MRALLTAPPRAFRVPGGRSRSVALQTAGSGRIRPRRGRDVPACARLLRRALFEGQFPGHGSEAPRAWLEGDDVVTAYVAVHGGEVVGHVAVSRPDRDPRSSIRWREVTGRPPSDLMAVSCLFVRPRFRGQGYGGALLAVAGDDIRARGLVPTIDVVSDRCAAPALYVDRGWRLRASDLRPDGLWVHRHEGPPPA